MEYRHSNEELHYVFCYGPDAILLVDSTDQKSNSFTITYSVIIKLTPSIFVKIGVKFI